jgi:hypothetical protein
MLSKIRAVMEAGADTITAFVCAEKSQECTDTHNTNNIVLKHPIVLCIPF